MYPQYTKVESITYKVIDLEEIIDGKELEEKLNNLAKEEFALANFPILAERFMIFMKIEMPKIEGEEIFNNTYPPVQDTNDKASDTFDKLNNLIDKMNKNY